MKHLKKLVAMASALALALCMGTAAFAAETGSITINNAVAGQTYTIYQVLDLESYNKDAEAYAYKFAAGWGGLLSADGATDYEYTNAKGNTYKASNYLAVDVQGYVTWIEGADAVGFAALAKDYAEKNSVANQGQATCAEGATTVAFSGLDLGYYLVDSTLGALCSLDTTNPNVEMEEKNAVPEITKEVLEDANNNWGETNDADINQIVNYKATITVQSGAENYVMHDTMSGGLTFLKVDQVTVGNEVVAAENYTVNADPTDECTFEVAFKDSYISTLAADTKIVVEYSAKLNENAIVGLEGNINEVKLQYGDANRPTYTPVDQAITYTWDAEVVKFTNKDGEEVKLAGAAFKLSTDNLGQSILKFHALGNNAYQVCADIACTKDHVVEITTDATGTFLIQGLDSGTYYLTETAAPAGYNKLAGPVTVVIAGATQAEGSTELIYTTVETKVENKSGTELPSTGGMGTTVLYILGGLMIVVAAVVLIARRRSGSVE